MLKRMFDLVVAAALAVILLPVILMVAVAIGLTIGTPILFRQSRPGLHGEPFTLVKFRTMIVGDAPDERRLTRLGRFLRATSFDELPSLWNVLRGDMSLVGPRPLLMEYLPLYDERQRRRHDVRPGITGWAQVNGRNAISWQRRFELDVWYVDNRSMWLDLKILGLTVVRVLGRHGINEGGQATMSRFNGNPRDGTSE